MPVVLFRIADVRIETPPGIVADGILELIRVARPVLDAERTIIAASLDAEVETLVHVILAVALEIFLVLSAADRDERTVIRAGKPNIPCRRDESMAVGHRHDVVSVERGLAVEGLRGVLARCVKQRPFRAFVGEGAD